MKRLASLCLLVLAPVSWALTARAARQVVAHVATHGAGEVGRTAAGSVAPLALGERDTLGGATPTLALRDEHPLRATGDASAADVRFLDRAEVRRRIREAGSGTYIDDILLDHDSALARWPDRAGHPLTVWVQPEPAVWDFDPAFVGQVRSAFAEWEATGIPVRFTMVRDSSAADVHVTWIDHFAEPISGKTVWSRDDDWWIVDAQITLAVHHLGGEALDPAAMHAIALHEVGHLIGLDHTRDASTIMTPRVHVRALTAADRATARLLYSLPPGAVR